MAVQSKPIPQYEFMGLNLSGNPITRPPGSAFVADNVRVMPGNWIRLVSGRVARRNLTSAKRVHRIISVQVRSSNLSDDNHLVLVQYASNVIRMCKFDLSTMLVDETGIETIDVGGSFVPDCRFCQAQLSNSVVFANGFGLPPPNEEMQPPSLTQWMPPSTIRYFGLREPFGEGNSIALFTPGSGHNTVQNSVRLFIGVHNVETQHYSNGVEIGEISTTSGSGTISVTIFQATAWSVLTHGAAETAEQRYVFYATIDGLNVPYLIMNAELDGPFTAPISHPSPDTGTQTVSLSITPDGTNGWILDTTKEMPINNDPPYMMRSIAFVSGRLYGIYADTPEFFSSQLSRSVVCWSQADGSQLTTDFLGDPLQSWPLQNVTTTPTAERPLAIFAAPNNQELMVFTATHTFLLREQTDNLQEWGDSISDEHGLYAITHTHAEALICRTRHGVCWLTQHLQIAIYTNNGELKILSSDYDALLSGADVFTCINYVYDPKNKIDRVDLHWQQIEVHEQGSWTISRSLCHDFITGATTTSQFPYVYAAQTVTSRISASKYFFLAASPYSVAVQDVNGLLSCGLFTYEGQPDHDGRIPTMMERYSSGTELLPSPATDLPWGYYIPNWLNFGDPNWVKQISHIDIIGDGALSPSLGTYPITLSCYAGFSRVWSNESLVLHPIQVVLDPQKTTPVVIDQYYRFKSPFPHTNFWKFALLIKSHAADYGQFYALPEDEGNLNATDNFYGSVVAMLYTIGPTENRL